ncbi:MAG: NAD(P)/FAD-dependent oxidoreductase [Verrucomicrobiales bacterium]|nr:NAD(P)/FAD-dependent oxidoreductase [Verrucomicrobiales bacterium]
MSDYDLIVIGGGASGFFAAITCAEVSPTPRRILILEKAPEVLQKVKISGGGRCNVTHDCHDPRLFVSHYPRGQKTLPGPLHRWNAADMINWLADKGVALKVEADGRIFPITDDSQTIIDCFHAAARDAGIEIRCRQEVSDVTFRDDHFSLELKSGEVLTCSNLLVATGGIRNPSGKKFAETFGHTTQDAAPSLFTFKITDPRIEGLAGISVPLGKATVSGTKFEEMGPILITHWGLSGPGILKVSAWGARELYEMNYRFQAVINWVAKETEDEVQRHLSSLRTNHGKQSIFANPQFSIPTRLWKRLCEAAEISPDTKWGNLSRVQLNALKGQLTSCEFQVEGKSMNKDEFVTCGGVNLKEVNFKTMESKLQPCLFFAGEVLDIDGVTGGFNFQSAWTTGRIVGETIGSRD